MDNFINTLSDKDKETKLSELKMHCGECAIIDFCNGYEDTPPCEQPRFKELRIVDFLEVIDYWDNRSLWKEED